MPRLSAGLVPWRRRDGRLEVLLVHPGGPLWAKKDEGAWMIPKGEPEEGEDLLDAARREVAEEIGWRAEGPFLELEPVRQAGGKVVHAWACESGFDPERLESGTFEMEWPPRSGRRRRFPEVDRAEWLDLESAVRKVLPSQRPILEDAVRRLGAEPGD